MGFMTGGLILKNGSMLKNKYMLKILGHGQYTYSGDLLLEEATSGSFNGIAFARVGAMLVVMGRDIAHSCSFEEDEISEVDKNLGVISKAGDILCFLINSVSDTYAWSIFSGGIRTTAKSAAGGELISEFGSPTKYDDALELNEQGMITLLENFTGYDFIDLVFEKKIRAESFS
jgi:hypothetical protein